MAWVKLDPAYRSHPKAVAAGPDGMLLDVCGMCYCAEHGTDGFVPYGAVPTLAPVRSLPKAVEALVRVGRWQRDDDRGGYWIHDYLDYNLTAEQDEALREKRRAAGSKGGKQSGSKRRANAEALASANGKQTSTQSQSSSSVESKSSSSEPVLAAVEEDERVTKVWPVLARKRLVVRKANTGLPPIGDDSAWCAKAAQRDREEHYERACQLAYDWPDITVDDLAEVLSGNSSRLRHAKRREAS